jgi:hypothetical protein
MQHPPVAARGKLSLTGDAADDGGRTMPRTDLYTTIHKAIRSEIFETTRAVARADFAEVDDAGRAAAAIRRLVGFLDEHALHEDEVLMPELARAAPELHAALEADHVRVDGLHRDLVTTTARLEGATQAERLALGQRLHERIVRLATEQLRHMDREEQEAQPVLWARFSDAELEALHGRIVGSIPPARMAEWLTVILPAVSVPERAVLLGGMRAAVPPPVFDALTAPARAALGERGWAATAAAIGT